MDHPRYRVDLPNGRSQPISAEQLRRIAQGLGDPREGRTGESEPAVLEALQALPAPDRAEALAVVLLRFGQKLDLETIAQSRGLSPWRVWQLEESFRDALAGAQARRRFTRTPLVSPVRA